MEAAHTLVTSTSTRKPNLVIRSTLSLASYMCKYRLGREQCANLPTNLLNQRSQLATGKIIIPMQNFLRLNGGRPR